MTRTFLIAALALTGLNGLAAFPAAGQAESRPSLAARPTFVRPAIPIVAKNGMVVAQEGRAARIGADILARGGNAVDAAIAVGFAMAVTYPRAGNIGGGGFMLIHRASDRSNIAIDYRETAPAALHRDSFLDSRGEPDPQKSRASGLGVGVPGTVAGLAIAHRKYGSGNFSLAQLIAPAIALARDGFPVEDDVADSLPRAQPRLVRYPASARIFLKPDGTALGRGDRLVQRDLAATLQGIADRGPDSFYRGPVADKIARAVRAAGGVMTADDLKNYQPIVRAPVRGTYRGYEIISMPPSSSGGVVLIEMLNILEGYDRARLAMADGGRAHLLVEAMKYAYADRAAYLGDPAVVAMPLDRLMSKPHAARMRARIDPARATPADAIGRRRPQPAEGDNTTHFSVIDRFGNSVSNTYTLNLSYGLGLVADGTGILLNNELDDFTAKPGAANIYGLVGFEANLPGPGKRPLSSMTPTIVLKDGKPFLITGSPGGSRIITTVLQIITNVIDRGMPIAAAVAAPRLHHQWLPDRVFAESHTAPSAIDALKSRGHNVVVGPPRTSANSILVTPQGLIGAADPRTRGALAVGY